MQLAAAHHGEELLLFTDGACAGNQNVALRHNPAGWGVAVVHAPCGGGGGGGSERYDGSSVGADPRCELLDDLHGPVVLSADSFGYLGAELGSNNTAELSAICEALLYLRDRATPALPAAICYDSEYAANIVQVRDLIQPRGWVAVRSEGISRRGGTGVV